MNNEFNFDSFFSREIKEAPFLKTKIVIRDDVNNEMIQCILDDIKKKYKLSTDDEAYEKWYDYKNEVFNG